MFGIEQALQGLLSSYPAETIAGLLRGPVAPSQPDPKASEKKQATPAGRAPAPASAQEPQAPTPEPASTPSSATYAPIAGGGGLLSDAEVEHLLGMRAHHNSALEEALAGILSQGQAQRGHGDNGSGEEFASWASQAHQKGMSAGKQGATPHASGGEIEMFKPKDWRGLLPKFSPVEEEPARIPRPNLEEASFTMRPARVPQPEQFVLYRPDPYAPQRYLYLENNAPRGLI